MAATQSTYLFTMQYKDTHTTLCRMNIRIEDKCSFCHCSWEPLKIWYLKETKQTFSPSDKKVILELSPEKQTHNSTLLVNKSHIYQCKLQGKLPRTNIFKLCLKDIYISELCITHTTNDRNFFLSKWTGIEHCFTEF